MPQKIVLIAGIGEVLLVKKRGSKSIRLSVTASGQVRVSVPPWVPYASGVHFAKARQEWLEKQLNKHEARFLEHGDRIGKSHRLEFISNPGDNISTRVTQTKVIIKSGLPLSKAVVQKKRCRLPKEPCPSKQITFCLKDSMRSPKNTDTHTNQ